MSLSMYHASLPTFIHGLGNLSNILTKAASHAQQKNIAPEVFLNARLAPDMLPLVKQVQIVSDMSKFGAARLAGVEPPSFPDTETTFEELQTRISNTINFLKTIDAAHIDGTEEKAIHLKIGGMELDFTGQDYLLSFVLPNFYFHISTAYGILRHQGVSLGKADFLGNA